MNSWKIIVVTITCFLIFSMDLISQYKFITRNDSIFENYSLLKFEKSGIEYNIVENKKGSIIEFKVNEVYNITIQKFEHFLDESNEISIRGESRYIYYKGEKIVNLDEVYNITDSNY